MIAGDQADPDVAPGKLGEHGLRQRPRCVGEPEQPDRGEFGAAEAFQQIRVLRGGRGLVGGEATLGHRQYPEAGTGHLVDLPCQRSIAVGQRRHEHFR